MSNKKPEWFERIINKAIKMPCVDGSTRVSKWAVVSNTDIDFENSVIEYQMITINDYEMTYVRPTVIKLEKKLPDNTTVKLEIFFMNMQNVKDKNNLLCLELTGICFNNSEKFTADEINLGYCRTCRYPNRTHFNKEYIDRKEKLNKPLFNYDSTVIKN